ncbi:hypothetical protein ACQ4PT_000580 [Festuca glaucescens]
MAASSRTSSKSLASSFTSQAGLTLPLVNCDCCGWRRAIRLVSQSEANPGRVFFRCPNHRKGGQAGSGFCDFYYWIEEYVELLLGKGIDFPAGALEELVMLGCELMPLTVEAVRKHHNKQMCYVQKQGRKCIEVGEKKKSKEDSIMLEIKQLLEKILYVCVLILLVCMYSAWK